MELHAARSEAAGLAGRLARRRVRPPALIASRPTVARFSLVPKDRVFFDLFTEAGQNTLRSAKLLRDMFQPSGPRTAASPATCSRPSRRATGSPTTSSTGSTRPS